MAEMTFGLNGETDWRVELSSVLFDYEAELVDSDTVERCVEDIVERLVEQRLRATE